MGKQTNGQREIFEEDQLLLVLVEHLSPLFAAQNILAGSEQTQSST
jgi:hypothetical protein